MRLKDIIKRDFWYDEAFTGIAIKENFFGLLQMIRQDVHPPLYYFSLKIFAWFFDYSVFGIRLFSLIFGMASIVVVYFLAKKLFGIRAGLFASLIVAVSPFAIQYSAEGRMYSMFVFLILVATYFFVLTLENKTKKINFLLLGFFVGLSSLTHYMGLVMLPIFYLSYLGWKNIEQKNLDNAFNIDNLKKLFVTFIPHKFYFLSLTIFILIFSFWIPNFIFHLGQSKNSNLDWIKPASFGDIPVNVQMFIFGTPLGEMSAGMPSTKEIEGIDWLSLSVLFVIFLTLLVVWVTKIKEKRKEIFLVLMFSFGFMLEILLLSLLGKNFFVARYLMSAGFFIFILLGFWLSRLRPIYLFLTVIIYLLLSFLTVDRGYSKGWNQFILDKDRYAQNEFYILNSFDYVIAKYYLGADQLTLYNLDWPQYNSDYWAAIGKSLKRTEKFSDLKNNSRVLIISNGPLPHQEKMDKEYYYADWEVVSQYENIFIYQLKR